MRQRQIELNENLMRHYTENKTKPKIRSSERTKYVNLQNVLESGPGLSRNLGIFVC